MRAIDGQMAGLRFARRWRSILNAGGLEPSAFGDLSVTVFSAYVIDVLRMRIAKEQSRHCLVPRTKWLRGI